MFKWKQDIKPYVEDVPNFANIRGCSCIRLRLRWNWETVVYVTMTTYIVYWRRIWFASIFVWVAVSNHSYNSNLKFSSFIFTWLCINITFNIKYIQIFILYIIGLGSLYLINKIKICLERNRNYILAMAWILHVTTSFYTSPLNKWTQTNLIHKYLLNAYLQGSYSLGEHLGHKKKVSCAVVERTQPGNKTSESRLCHKCNLAVPGIFCRACSRT